MNFLIYGKTPTEIEFLSKQTMVFANGSRSTVGTIATITPVSGKTFVLLGALVAPIGMTIVGAGLGFKVELRNQANVRSILGNSAVTFGGSSSGAGWGYCPSLVKGDILVGDGIKTYTLEATVVTNCNISGSIYGYLINT